MSLRSSVPGPAPHRDPRRRDLGGLAADGPDPASVARGGR
jgi:hypothetical protein